jgi:hypothetical protein
MRLCSFQQGQGLGVQRASFQYEHRDVPLTAVDEVGDHHVFGTEAGGLRDRGEVGRSALQQRLCLGQLGGKVRAGLGVLLGGFGRGVAGRNQMGRHGVCCVVLWAVALEAECLQWRRLAFASRGSLPQRDWHLQGTFQAVLANWGFVSTAEPW